MQQQQGHPPRYPGGQSHKSHTEDLDEPDRKEGGKVSSFTGKNMGDPKEGRKGPSTGSA